MVLKVSDDSGGFLHEAFTRLQDQLNYNPDDPDAEFQPEAISALRLMRDPDLPVSIHAINQFSQGAKKRLYRTLISPQLLTAYKINPITWRGPDGKKHVVIVAPPEKGVVKIVIKHRADAQDPIAYLELVDNSFNGINVVLLVLNDPDSERFDVDVSEAGEPTLFGTVHRNRAAEAAAKEAGLAPGQVRSGLRASRTAVQHLEAFLMMMGHSVYYGEPLTYAAAILFERRGFSYISGRRLMQQIDHEFRPGGVLHKALDGSTPFRQPEQADTVRGRAWAIQDGLLEEIGARWDGLRMAKRLGHKAGVNTFSDAVY